MLLNENYTSLDEARSNTAYLHTNQFSFTVIGELYFLSWYHNKCRRETMVLVVLLVNYWNTRLTMVKWQWLFWQGYQYRGRGGSGSSLSVPSASQCVVSDVHRVRLPGCIQSPNPLLNVDFKRLYIYIDVFCSLLRLCLLPKRTGRDSLIVFIHHHRTRNIARTWFGVSQSNCLFHH